MTSIRTIIIVALVLSSMQSPPFSTRTFFILYSFLPSCLFLSMSSTFLTPLSFVHSVLSITNLVRSLTVHFSPHILPFFLFFHGIEDLKTISTLHYNVTINPALRIISFYCITLSVPIILLYYVLCSFLSFSDSYSSFISKLTHRISESILISTFKISKVRGRWSF